MAPAPLAATRTAVQSGNWSDPNTWGGSVPASGDDVVINTGITVTVNVNVSSIKNLTVNGTLNFVNNNLTIANNGSITVGGTVNFTGTGVINDTGTGSGTTLTISPGATIATANPAGFNTTTGTGTDPIGGSFNIQKKGIKTYDPGANYTYNGIATQNTGSGLPTIISGKLTILNSAGVKLNNITPTGTITINSPGTLTVNGLLQPTEAQVIAGSGTLTGSGTVEVSRTAATPDFSSQYTITNKTLSNLTVNYNGTGAQTISAIDYGNLTISANGPRTVTLPNSGNIGISGTFNPTATSTTYTITGSTVNFNGSGTQSIPANFSFNNLSTSTGGIKSAGSPVTVQGNLSIGSNTTLATGAALNVAGNFSNAGNFTHNNGSVNLNGAAQTISGNTSFYILNLSGTGNKDFGNAEVTIGNSFTANGGSMVGGSSTFIFNGSNGSITGANAKNFYKLQINNGASIAVNGGTLNISNSFINNGAFNQSAGNTTFNNNQTLTGTGTTTFGGLTVQSGSFLNAGTHNFTINGGSLSASSGGTFNGGTATVAFTGASSIGNGTGTINFNNLTIGSGTLSNSTNKNFSLSGNWTNNGTYTAGAETITLNGAAQTIGGNNSTTFSNLTLAGTADKTLDNDISVTTTLSLSDKKINTGNYVLTADNITRTSGYIVGSLRKNFSPGNNGRSFDIGTSLYTPVTINFNIVTNSGFLTARTTDADHPSINTSTIDPSQTVNRHWTIIKDNNLAFNNYAISFGYNVTENDNIIHAPAYILGKFDGGTWTYPTITSSPTTTSLTAAGLTSFSDFQVGREKNIAPVLAQIGDKSVDEKTLLTFTATATDENLPANT
ncbi:MAG TPA: G8 domain-containing protein, partial [Daejeonella sp.]|nr:G8 domain-containing protein [Daejeonella sp.]